MRLIKYLKVSLISLMLFVLSGCGSQPELPKIPGVQGPNFNVLNGAILISLQLETFFIPTGGRFPIPKLDNSYVEATPAQTGGTLFAVSLDLKDIESGDFRFVDPQTLPGGRPLPGVLGGELPSLAVQIPTLFNTTFYVSKQVFGFFLPISQMNFPGLEINTYPINLEGRHLGNISIVNKDSNGQNAGLLLLLNLKAAEIPHLKALLRESRKKKNFNRIY